VCAFVSPQDLNAALCTSLERLQPKPGQPTVPAVPPVIMAASRVDDDDDDDDDDDRY